MAWGIEAIGEAASLTPLAGGWSGRTLLAEALDGSRCVVRVYPPGSPEAAMAPETEAAVLRLVRGLLPAPEVLDVRRTTPEHPGLLLMSVLPGVRAHLVLADLDAQGRAHVGRGLGALAAALAAMPMLERGLFGSPTLQITPFPGGDLPDWIETHRARLIDTAGWTPAAVDRLAALGEPAQDLLDGVDRAALVHSDLNPKNVLLDPDTLAVTGLVDWEFAHAGHPATDLGNLVRFERHHDYVDAVLSAYAERHPAMSEHLLDLARAADLVALCELASRAAQAPAGSPARLAEELLAAIATEQDWHAWPASWTQEAPRA